MTSLDIVVYLMVNPDRLSELSDLLSSGETKFNEIVKQSQDKGIIAVPVVP